MKGLIIKPYWTDLILSGDKTMELRSSNTKIRGTIGLIKSGSKKVYGTVDFIDCILLSKELYYNYKDKHRVDKDFKEIPYNKLYGWILNDPIKFDEPIPYNHKKGCVIWINLEGDEFENI